MTRPAKRNAVPSAMIIASLVIVICLVVSSGQSARADAAGGVYSGAVPVGYTNDNSAENKAAAKKEAKRLLTLVNLPAGAKPLTAEPKGDHGYLRSGLDIPASDTLVVRREWRIVPDSPGAVLKYVRSHKPAGSKWNEGGKAFNKKTGTNVVESGYSLPPLKDVIRYREILVSATKLVNGKTGVLIESQIEWTVLRKLSERIPANVAQIEIHATPAMNANGKRKPGSGISVDVTKAPQVSGVVGIVNGFGVSQPATLSCPAELFKGERDLTMRFLSSTGNTVAKLNYADWPPSLQSSWECNSVSLIVSGKRGAALNGGYFVRKTQKLLGKPIV